MAIEIVDFPIKNGDFPWQNFSSPEGILDLLHSIGELCFMIHTDHHSWSRWSSSSVFFRWHTWSNGTLNLCWKNHFYSFTYNFNKHWLTYVLPMISLWFSTYPPGQLTFCQARCSFSSAGRVSWCWGISHSHACNYCRPVTSQGDLKIISLYTYIILYTSCIYIYIYIHHIYI